MQAKEFLSQRGVVFESIDVSTLDDPVGTLRSLTGGPVATPTVVIGDQARVGFDPDWMAQQLAG